MSVATELVELVERAAEHPLPSVAECFLPPARADLGMEGEFCALRLSDGSVGMAFVLLGDTLIRLQERRGDAPAGGSPLDLARGLLRDDPVARALGLAAVNAVTQCVFRRAGYRPDLATNSLGSLDLGPRDRLGMVGLFPPLVRRVRELGIPLTVVELRAELVQEAPGFDVTLDPGRLAACNKIVCTSAVLLNDTLEDILRHGRAAEGFALIGPSAGCFPDPLFARGVSIVGAHWVADAGTFMRRARAREPWGDAAVKSCIRREAYPGTAALLARQVPR